MKDNEAPIVMLVWEPYLIVVALFEEAATNELPLWSEAFCRAMGKFRAYKLINTAINKANQKIGNVNFICR